MQTGVTHQARLAFKPVTAQLAYKVLLLNMPYLVIPQLVLHQEGLTADLALVILLRPVYPPHVGGVIRLPVERLPAYLARDHLHALRVLFHYVLVALEGAEEPLRTVQAPDLLLRPVDQVEVLLHVLPQLEDLAARGAGVPAHVVDLHVLVQAAGSQEGVAALIAYIAAVVCIHMTVQAVVVGEWIPA